MKKLNFNKKQKVFIAAGVLALGALFIGGNKVYQSFSSNVFPDAYNAATVVKDTTGKEGYVLVDKIIKFSVVNPFIVQGSDNNYYLYGSNITNSSIQDNASNNNVSFYFSDYNVSDNDYKNHEMSWDKVSSQTINGLPENVSKPLSPKVYKIGNYYYMIFTLITKNSSDSYNAYNSATKSSVYYAVSTTLTQDTVWTYKGEVPYGRDYFLTNGANYKTGDTSSKNLNHSSGSFLVEDSNNNLEFDDNDSIYFYYHAETEVTGNGDQAIYGTKISANNGALSLVNSNPTLIMSKDTANADLVTDPYVIKEGNSYRLYYSTEISEDLYSYNIDSAVGTTPLSEFTVDNRQILTDRCAGGLSVFQIYIKDDA